MNKEEFVAYHEKGSISIPNVFLWEYHKLGLSEQEFTLILLVYSYLQRGKYFPTPTELSEHMSISTSTCTSLLRGLIQRGFLYIEEFEQNSIMYEKYSLAPLWEKLYHCIKSQNQKSESNDNEKNLYTIFEQEFGRPLSPFECETLSIWIDQDHHDPDIIIAALREAVISGKLNFRYIDRILFEWKKNGIQTIDQARQYAKRFRDTNKKMKTNQSNKEYKRIVPFYNWLDGE